MDKIKDHLHQDKRIGNIQDKIKDHLDKKDHLVKKDLLKDKTLIRINSNALLVLEVKGHHKIKEAFLLMINRQPGSSNQAHK
jgi:hypothetical protein